jgi:hypothetical protein
MQRGTIAPDGSPLTSCAAASSSYRVSVVPDIIGLSGFIQGVPANAKN